MNNSKKLIMAVLCLFILSGLKAQDLAFNHKDLPCLNKHFNLYVHITQDSLGSTNLPIEQIQAAVDETNEAFAPICVSFEICKVDTMANYKLDSLDNSLEVREVTSLYGHDNRINVYFFDKYFSPGICGFANLSQVNSPTASDVFILKPCGGGTMIHEFGHLFGLQHTFEGNREELVNGSNCETAGDEICDTPADPFMVGDSMSWYIGPNCEFIFTRALDDNGEWFQPDVGNFMSYYPCACGFTRDQYLKMVETYNETELKNW